MSDRDLLKAAGIIPAKPQRQEPDQQPEVKKIILPVGYTANQLLNMEFPEQTFVIPGRLTVGAALLCGPPKLGKSWYCMGLGLTWSGKFDVLYLALEDTPLRLQNRLKIMLDGKPGPPNFFFFTEWPKLDKGGIEQLKEFLQLHPLCRLVMVDTLAKVRHKKSKNAGLYEDDYEAVTGLKMVADKHSAAIVAVHHVNKSKPQDILETVSGTTGLTAAADTILIMGRERGQADGTLFITGRDVEEQDLAMSFDKQTCTWSVMGEAQEYRISKERQEILDVLKRAGKPLSPVEVAKELGKNERTTKNLMYALLDSQLIKQIGYGRYIPHSLYSLSGDVSILKASEDTQETMPHISHSLFDGKESQETIQTTGTKDHRDYSNILDTGTQVDEVIF